MILKIEPGKFPDEPNIGYKRTESRKIPGLVLKTRKDGLALAKVEKPAGGDAEG